jgi:3-oxoacyl-[acyl-carrier protein] reductase
MYTVPHQAVGGRATHVAADVTDRTASARIVDTAACTYGGIDILVNNAGT